MIIWPDPPPILDYLIYGRPLIRENLVEMICRHILEPISLFLALTGGIILCLHLAGTQDTLSTNMVKQKTQHKDRLSIKGEKAQPARLRSAKLAPVLSRRYLLKKIICNETKVHMILLDNFKLTAVNINIYLSSFSVNRDITILCN